MQLLELICQVCESELVYSLDRERRAMIVSPCINCLTKEFDNGYNAGLREGDEDVD